MKRKTKQISAVVVSILMVVVLVSASVLDNVNQKVIVPEKEVGVEGELTFKVGKESYTCNVNEPDGKIDENDITSCARQVVAEGVELEDIKDWNNKYYKGKDENGTAIWNKD